MKTDLKLKIAQLALCFVAIFLISCAAAPYGGQCGAPPGYAQHHYAGHPGMAGPCGPQQMGVPVGCAEGGMIQQGGQLVQTGNERVDHGHQGQWVQKWTADGQKDGEPFWVPGPKLGNSFNGLPHKADKGVEMPHGNLQKMLADYGATPQG